MKRKILVIHNGYPLRGDGGDKVRTLNMLQSLDSIGFDVCLLAFFKKDFSLLALNKKSVPWHIFAPRAAACNNLHFRGPGRGSRAGHGKAV